MRFLAPSPLLSTLGYWVEKLPFLKAKSGNALRTGQLDAGSVEWAIIPNPEQLPPI